jgi:hypothetical protein
MYKPFRVGKQHLINGKCAAVVQLEARNDSSHQNFVVYMGVSANTFSKVKDRRFAGFLP